MSLNDFEIIKQLDNEGNTSIIKVKRKKDGIFYLLKNLNFQSLNKIQKEKIHNEIKILSSLNHPNIIQFKEAFYDKQTKTLNIITESANDGNLRNKINFIINKGFHMEECTIWEVLTQILHGLNYLHKKQIILRNLKSSNIYLTKLRLIKITDFYDCYQLNHPNNFSKNIFNVSLYSAPELLNEKKNNYKVDIWSLGCIIYEMACLSLPFNGENNQQLYNNIINDKKIPIPNFYSKNLQYIINSMLTADPSKRPSSEVLLNYPNVRETTLKLSLIYNKYKTNINIKKNLRIIKIDNNNMINSHRETKSKTSLSSINDLDLDSNLKNDNFLDNVNAETKIIKSNQNDFQNQYLNFKITHNATYRTLFERNNLSKNKKEQRNEGLVHNLSKINNYNNIMDNFDKKENRYFLYNNYIKIRPNPRKIRNNIATSFVPDLSSFTIADTDIAYLIYKKNANNNNLEDINSNINFKKENEIDNEKNKIYEYKKFQKSKKSHILNSQKNNNINNKLPKNNNKYISPIKSKPKFETNILYKGHKNINREKKNINNKSQINRIIKFNSYKNCDLYFSDINRLNRNNHDLILNDNDLENQITNNDIQHFNFARYDNGNVFSNIINKKKLDTKIIRKSNTYFNKNIFLLKNNNINKNSIRFFKEDLDQPKISSITALNYNDIYREKIFNNEQCTSLANVNTKNINKRSACSNNAFMEYPSQLKQISNSYIIKVKNNLITPPKNLKKDSINNNNII